MTVSRALIICEKPSAAAKIASALAEGKPLKRELNGVPYYEFERDGKQMVVVPALGHLFTLKNVRPMHEYPVYDVDWVPTYEVNRRAERARAFAEAIKELAKGADEFICGCDFDLEGELIGFNVLRFLCGEHAVKVAKRMKFSALTAQDLRRAYENMLPQLSFEMVDSGIARHVLDWYWGMNTSKALSSAVEAAHQRFAKLSAGRVQSPALKILVERELQIKAFKPEPFWVVGLLIELEGKELRAEHAVPKFTVREEAERVRDICQGKPALITSIQTRQYRQPPPVPFDLGLLQAEAYRCFGYTPMRTQQLAQNLYLAGLITYPRTSSQKLPPTINYAEIIERLGEIPRYRKFAESLLAMPELKPNEGPKVDPAHPSCHPTGEKPEKLTGPQQKLYDLIVRRFFSVFGTPALKESIKVELDVSGQKFYLRGRRILEEGWLTYYGPYGATEEVILPQLSEGQTLLPKRVLFEEKETQPPPRYNPASIVKELEKRNLGTKATRAPIIQTLYDRGYIFGNQISVTELGIAVVNTLSKYCPEIVSEELTAHFEKEMEAIQEAKRSSREVIEKAKAKLDEIFKKFRQHQLEIGKELGEAYRRTKQLQKTLGTCPMCGGQLKIIVSRKTHKRFVGCSNYQKGCKNSFPLPQNGSIIPMDKTCERCGAPMIQVNRQGMRPYRMCLDPRCPSKEDWGKKKAGIAPDSGGE
jgi:DNA topoisomerase-1